MGLFSNVPNGTWWLRSRSDPRWNMSGKGIVGGLAVPSGAKRAIEEKRKELGEEPPDDLEFNYMKD